MINEFKYGQTWNIWPSPLSLSLYSTFEVHRVHAVVDIKPIYLNKRYLFQNKIYYLDKIYFCFAKIKPSKHTLYKLDWLPDYF